MLSSTSKPNEFHVEFVGSVSSTSSLLSKKSAPSIHDSVKSLCNNSTASKSLCRICQSETGPVIRPCACAGTVSNTFFFTFFIKMGGIHANCLNKWIIRSKRETCEICNTEYAKSGNEMLPFREWRKPQITQRNIFQFIALIGLSYSFFYLILLIQEREFIYRVFLIRQPVRDTDIGRIVLLLLLAFFILITLSDVYGKIYFYFKKQKVVRFINLSDSAPDAKKMTKMNKSVSAECVFYV